MVAGRLEVSGWLGAAASTHWLASQSAMGTLETGGNAFDAAVVAGLVMQVAQPHLNGPAGDVAIMLHHGGSGDVTSICGQGPAPGDATLENFRALGLDHIPGTGLLPAVVPGAFDAWMRLLAEHGTITLRAAFEPATLYARQGIEVDQRLHDILAAAAPVFERYWPTSAAHCLDDRRTPPAVGSTFRNTTLAEVWQRLVEEAESQGNDRDIQIEAARKIWSDGFIADAITDFARRTKVMDVSGRRHATFLTARDVSGWRAPEERTRSVRFAEHRVHKCGMWTQGMVLLQALNLMSADALAELDPTKGAFVHQVTEALKLALADRDTHYGLSKVGGTDVEARIARLLASSYGTDRRALVGDTASVDFRPGDIDETRREVATWRPDFETACTRQREAGMLAAYGGGEPTIVHDSGDPAPEAAVALTAAEKDGYLARSTGDTSYLCVSDRDGNVVSATPSGGWLQSSPIIPELGFPLGTRAQMMWLDPHSPSGLQPRARPRSTLSPTIVTHADGSVLAVGTPGGDQQDQWQTAFLIRYLVHEMSMQEALDAPGFHTDHVVNSFYPRGAAPGSLVVEDRFEADEIDALRTRGHNVSVTGSWAEGRLCAVRKTADGRHRAAVSRRGGQSLAVAR